MPKFMKNGLPVSPLGTLTEVIQAGRVSFLSEEDELSILMMRNMIAQIEAGNLTTVDRLGYKVSDDEAVVGLKYRGTPKPIESL